MTTRLSEEFGADVDVVLIDKTEDFVFGFSKLEVMFGRTRDPNRSGTNVPASVSTLLEFGHNEVAKVDVTFADGYAPRGTLEGPSLTLAGDKAEFGSSRCPALVRAHLASMT